MMLRITFFLVVMLFGSGCVITYTNEDSEPGMESLMGRRCVVSETARLPIAQWHLPKILMSDSSHDWDTTEIMIDKGTILRVVHFECRHGAHLSIVSVQAEAENGPQKGARVVIGQIVTPWQLKYRNVIMTIGLLKPLSEEDENYIFHWGEDSDELESREFFRDWRSPKRREVTE